MKKLFLSILVICSLLGGNAYADEFKKKGNKDWYVYETTSQRVRIYDIKNAKGLDNIHFTGFVSSHEINKAMQQSHVGLVLMKGGITKYWIGNKIGEYIASSFGIVNNVETEIADVINKYDIGLNVSSENPRAVADAIIEYLKAPSKLRDHMVNSNSLYKQSFDRIENSKIYIEHLEKIYRQF